MTTDFYVLILYPVTLLFQHIISIMLESAIKTKPPKQPILLEVSQETGHICRTGPDHSKRLNLGVSGSNKDSSRNTGCDQTMGSPKGGVSTKFWLVGCCALYLCPQFYHVQILYPLAFDLAQITEIPHRISSNKM